MYGIWTVLKKSNGYLTASGARPTQALKCVIANKQASDDTDEKRRYVGSAIVVCFLFLPLQLAIGFTVAWFTPVWLSVPDEYVNTVRIAGFLLVSGPLLRNFVGIPKSVLEGENLGYKRMGLSGLLVFVGGAFTLLALYADTGLIGVAAASLATLLLTGFLYLQVARSQVPWFGIRMPKWEMAKGFVGLSGWFLIWKLIIKVLMDADVIILGILASAQLVTFYSLTKFGPELLVNFVAIVAFGSTPGLGGIIGRRDFEKARQVRGELMLLSWFVICVVGSVILLWNDSFLRLWVGPGYTASYELTLLLVAMVAQLVLIRNDANIIDMTLDLPKKIGLGAVAAIITIGLSSYLVGWRDGGAIGVCVVFWLADQS